MTFIGSAFRTAIPAQRITPALSTFKYNSWAWNNGGTTYTSHGGIQFDNNRTGSYLLIAMIITASTGFQANPPSNVTVYFPQMIGGQFIATATRVNQSTGRGNDYTKGMFFYMVRVPSNCYSTAQVSINAPSGQNYYSTYIMVHQVQGWMNSLNSMTASVDATAFTTTYSTATAGHAITTLAHTIYANRKNLIFGLAIKGYTDAEVATTAAPVVAGTSATVANLMSGTWNQSNSNSYGYIFYAQVVDGGETDSTHSVVIDFPTQAIPTTLFLGTTVKV